MAKYTFKSDLSERGLKKLKKDLVAYQIELAKKVDLFTKELALEGVYIARNKIGEKDAVFTSELLNSMNLRKGDVIHDGSQWVIYTDCEWAQYVEYGTGIVGLQNQHPQYDIVGWRYDKNEHGESGWFYFRDGEWHWTKGMPSRPFMYETALELPEKVNRIAKEVFW